MITESDKVAIISGDNKITYRELLQQTTIFSNHLKVNPGAIVLVYSEPRVGYASALYAIWNKKARYSTWFHNLPIDTLIWVLDDLQPAAIFTSLRFLDAVEKAVALSSMNIQILLIDELEKIPITVDTPVANLSFSLQDIAFTVYTAGITGKHKPVLLSYYNILHIANVLIRKNFFLETDRVIILLPFYNNWILLSTLVFPLFVGATCVICPEINEKNIIEILNKYKISVFVCVQNVYYILINYIADIINSSKLLLLLFYISSFFNSKSLSKLLFKKIHKRFGNSIRYFLTIGTKIEPAIVKYMLAFGFDVFEGYGMAECASVVTIPVSKRINLTSVGKFVDGIRYKIIDKEIVVQGPNVATSYYNRIVDNDNNFNGNWFFTGDEGYLDNDDYLYIIGRTNEAIKLPSGRLIFPLILEKELESRNDKIKEVGIFYNDNMLKAIIIPTPEFVNELGVDDNYIAIHEYFKWQVVEIFNHTQPFHKRIKKIIISEDSFLRSTSGKLKRYLLPEYDESTIDCHEFEDISST